MSNSAAKHFPLIAAIDLGSNSFHIVLAETQPQEIRIIKRIGAKVQLAAGLNEQLQLQDDAMQRGLDCLRGFTELIHQLPRGAVRIVGTSSLRIARNRQTFIQGAEQILGHPIDIISGREEARLIYLGVAHSLADAPNQRLVIDIGGGSTEFIIGQQFESQLRGSLPMGCVSLTQRFFADGIVTPQGYTQAYTAARLELSELEHSLRRMGWQDTVGASGTIRSIGLALAEAGLTQGEINRSGLNWLKQQVLDIADINKIAIPGVKAERSSILPAGLAIMEAIFDALQISHMTPCDSALREGLLYDLQARHQHNDIREDSIQELAQRSAVDTYYTQKIERQSLQALAQVAEAWQLKEEWHSNLLCWAARTQHIGLDIAHYHYHKHGAYLIEHSDLPGFSRQEQHMLALLVRSHRRNIPLERFAELPKSAAQQLLYLCVVLRVAILLQHIADNQKLPQLLLTAKTNHLEIGFPQGWLANNPLTAAYLEKEAQWLARTGFTLSAK